jgi:hypothetical protein
LVSDDALADVARVLVPAGVVAINVVDAPGLPETRRIAASLHTSFETVVALGASAVVHGRKTGNVVLVAGRGPVPVDRLRTALARDPSPAQVVSLRRFNAR